jgi:hypothetical protein
MGFAKNIPQTDVKKKGATMLYIQEDFVRHMPINANMKGSKIFATIVQRRGISSAPFVDIFYPKIDEQVGLKYVKLANVKKKE